jgi:hypothetical protein
LKQPQPTDRASVCDGRWLLVYGAAGSGDANDLTASVDTEERLVAPLTGEKLVPELYDLETDPGCLADVLAGNKERAVDLHRRFVEFLKHSPMRKEHVGFYQKIG